MLAVKRAFEGRSLAARWNILSIESFVNGALVIVSSAALHCKQHACETHTTALASEHTMIVLLLSVLAAKAPARGH